VIQQVVSTPRKGSQAPAPAAAAPAPVVVVDVEAKSASKPKPKPKQKQRPQTARPLRSKKKTKKAAPSVGSSFADAPRSGFYTGQVSYRKYGSVAKDHHKQLKTKKQLWAQYTFLHGKSPPKAVQANSKAKTKQTQSKVTTSVDPALTVVGTSLASPENSNTSGRVAVDFSKDAVVVRAEKALALEQLMLGLTPEQTEETVQGGTSGGVDNSVAISDALNESAAAVVMDELKDAVVAAQQEEEEEKEPEHFTYEYPEWWRMDADMVWPGQTTYDAQEIKNRPATAPASCAPVSYSNFYPPNTDVPPAHDCQQSAGCAIFQHCIFEC
jgi:hypothetical protein